ncbi:RE1-silencing transcription factor-like isoform X2 [Protopterus annectens]|uniref:RE1-silencing transcription factor-like isoform X2 n=1 Tax=Protopterus annectens TaxID=7888 RepID=UPI001CFBAF4D|nr:RE1-silencing transcription factor-like isoform X2 [Protopterus annectens]
MYQCLKCPYSTSKLFQLNRHMWTHSASQRRSLQLHVNARHADCSDHTGSTSEVQNYQECSAQSSHEDVEQDHCKSKVDTNDTNNASILKPEKNETLPEHVENCNVTCQVVTSGQKPASENSMSTRENKISQCKRKKANEVSGRAKKAKRKTTRRKPKPLSRSLCEYEAATHTGLKKHQKQHINLPICCYATSKEHEVQLNIKSSRPDCSANSCDVEQSIQDTERKKSGTPLSENSLAVVAKKESK